ncbi:MAG: exosortase/archaeosortase family protein [Myxococcota bacterium]
MSDTTSSSERDTARDPVKGALAGPFASPLFWLAAVAVVLAIHVYRPLFFPPVDRALALQGEEFFFEANQSAGLPVLVLAGWLFYRRSHYRDLLTGPGSPLLGALVLVPTLALFVWGTYTSAPDLRLLTAVPLLAGTVLLLGGPAALRAFWVPIAFLLFALPIPPVLLSTVIFPIQLVTAKFAGIVLNGIGVESYVQGDQILRPENTFVVIETCSGVKTIVTLSMLTVLLIDLFERRGWHAAILLVITPFVAFLTNGLRVVTLVLNPHSSIHSIHNLQGIAMLLVGLTGIYLIDGLLERLLGTRDPSVEAGDYGIANTDHASAARQRARLVALIALLAAFVLVDREGPRWPDHRGIAELPDDLLARVFGDALSVRVQPDYQFTGSVRYLAHARRRVEVDGAAVDVHLGIADEQERRFTMLSPRLAWPDSGYAPVEQRDVALEPGGPIARRIVLRRGARTVLSYSWIARRGGFWNEWWRQAAALDRSPFARPEHMLAIRLVTPVERGEQGVRDAEARIRSAWARLGPELEGYAPTRYVPSP